MAKILEKWQGIGLNFFFKKIITNTTMLESLLKLFTEEPDKLKKISFGIIKTILTVTFAGYLYKKTIGPVQENLPANFNAWIDYFTNGHLLMYIFILFVAYSLLFLCIAPLCAFVFWGLTKSSNKKVAIDHELEKLILKLFDIIHFNKMDGTIKLGRNFQFLYQLSKEFKRPEEVLHEQINHNNSFFEIGNLFFSFATVYFTSISSIAGFKNMWWLVILIGGVLWILYIGYKKILNYMEHNHEELIAKLDATQIIVSVEEVLKEHNIPFRENASFKETFSYEGREYCFYTKLLMRPTAKQLSHLKEFAAERKGLFFIAPTSNNSIHQQSKEATDVNYKVIVWHNAKNFKKQLSSLLTEFPKKELSSNEQ